MSGHVDEGRLRALPDKWHAEVVHLLSLNQDAAISRAEGVEDCETELRAALLESASEPYAFTDEDKKELSQMIKEKVRVALASPLSASEAPHEYSSTSCQHDKHEQCRKFCKFCGAKCQCMCHMDEEKEAQAVLGFCDYHLNLKHTKQSSCVNFAPLSNERVTREMVDQEAGKMAQQPVHNALTLLIEALNDKSNSAESTEMAREAMQMAKDEIDRLNKIVRATPLSQEQPPAPRCRDCGTLADSDQIEYDRDCRCGGSFVYTKPAQQDAQPSIQAHNLALDTIDRLQNERDELQAALRARAAGTEGLRERAIEFWTIESSLDSDEWKSWNGNMYPSKERATSWMETFQKDRPQYKFRVAAWARAPLAASVESPETFPSKSVEKRIKAQRAVPSDAATEQGGKS